MGKFQAALLASIALLCFICGAATTAILINWARKRRLHSEYALSLFAEAVLLLIFGLLGGNLSARWGMTLIILVLCFVMGLQNAIITKISQAQIRTTHVTGLVTDIGIELGKALYWNHNKLDTDAVHADGAKLLLLSQLLLMFFLGGFLGALGFF